MSGTKHRAKGQAFHPCPVYRCVNNNNSRYCDIPTTRSDMDQSSSSPATNNAIRGAEQAGNMAKQWFAGKVSKVRGFMATRRGADNKRWVARRKTIASRPLSMAMVVKVSKVMVILREIPQGRRTVP